MNPTEFSVLLLAWDDADPGVAVLGGAALPPTLPLVYQLAARHPVLAMYPHLPAAEAAATATAASAAAATEAPSAPTWPEPGIIPNPLDADTSGPGVRLLPPAEPTSFTPSLTGGSRLVGLDDLLPAIQGALPTSHSLARAPGAARASGGTPAARTSTPIRSQWPARTGSPLGAAWQAPAAPYAGATALPLSGQTPSYATARETFPPPPPAPPRPAPATRAPSAEEQTAEATAAKSVTSAAAVLPAQPASDAASEGPAPFGEPVAEMGAAEARDLDAPEDDLVPDATPRAPTQTAPATATAAVATATEAAAPAAPSWAVRQPTLDGLNFRMIQYARQAAQLVADRLDFGVIYAPGWPTWLAALEIRNRSGRPLVLYAATLASATAPAAERGWLLGLERMALRRARLVLVPDAGVLRQLRTHHADALGEIRIVPADDEVGVQRVLAEVALG